MNRRTTTDPCSSGGSKVLRHFLRGARHLEGGGETVFHSFLFKFSG